MARISKATRWWVLRRDDFRCRYCAARAPEASIHVDHVLPRSLGGSDAAANLTASCEDCNLGRSDSVLGPAMVEWVSTVELVERWWWENVPRDPRPACWQSDLRLLLDFGAQQSVIMQWLTHDHGNPSDTCDLDGESEPFARWRLVIADTLEFGLVYAFAGWPAHLDEIRSHLSSRGPYVADIDRYDRRRP